MDEIDSSITSTDMMSLIYGEIERKGIAGHHINSMNTFYSVGMKQIMTNIYKIEFRMRNLRDSTDEDKLIQEIHGSVTVTRVDLRKPTQNLYKSGAELPLMPQTARDSGLTYSCDIFNDVEVTVTATMVDGTTSSRTGTIKSHRFGAIPCMLGSDMCHTTNLSRETLIDIGEDPNDPGGTFIINGTTWAVNSLENLTYNAFHAFKRTYKKELARGLFISKAGDAFENSFQHILRFMSDGLITFDIITNKSTNLEIPFYLLFRALGMTSDKEIVSNISYGVDNPTPLQREIIKIIKKSFEAPIGEYEPMRRVVDSDKIITFIGRKIITVENEAAARNNDDVSRYINHQFLNIVDKNILSHIGTEPEHRIKKLRFIGHLINELILVYLGVMESTDRDSYSNKRIFTAGTSIAKSFKQLYNFSVCKEIIRHMKSEFKSTSFSKVDIVETVKNSIKPDELERLLSQSITAGNKTMMVKRSEVKNRVSSQSISVLKNNMYLKAVLGTISAPNFNTSKQTDRADEMRRVHFTFICFADISMSADTGEMVGMNKQQACMASIGPGTSSFTLKRIILEDQDILRDVAPEHITELNLAKVFVNGDWVGCCRYAHNIVRKYRSIRRNNGIHNRTSIVWEPLVRKVLFFTDIGRMHRPLIIVYNNITEYVSEWRSGNKTVVFKQWIKLNKSHIIGLQKKTINMEQLEKEGVIEYITPEEQLNAFIAPNIDELRKVSDSLKHMYTHCDIDQAILSIVTLASQLPNYSSPTRITYFTNHRKQSAGWPAMNYPYLTQKNVMMQWYNELPLVSTFSDSLTYPTGHNVILGVATLDGIVQEDGLYMSQTSVDCGLYNASYYTFKKSELEKEEQFENIDKLRTRGVDQNANYEFIENGVIRVGSPVTEGTVLICKTLKLSKPVDNFTHVDKSTIYHGSEDMRVERVIIGQNENNSKFIKIKLRSMRNLNVGDKMSTRTGNKGIYSKRNYRINMPYMANGMRCSIIGGPHSFPSRMAVNQSAEVGCGIRAARKGMLIDATAFQDIDLYELQDDLNKYEPGSKMGNRNVINGMTNEWNDTPIFMGPCYYMRLQKSAVDSQYAMLKGPTTAKYRQPLEGRANDGGLRVGEMETWVYVAQGAMRSLDEKFYVDSDGYDLPVCRCGSLAIVNKKLNLYRCDKCGDNASIGLVSSSWSTNVFTQEVLGLNIDMSFGLSPFTFENK